MTAFNAGDIVRVTERAAARTSDGTDKLVGLIFEVLDDGYNGVTLDVTAASKKVKGFEGWYTEKEGQRGWFVEDRNLELIAPARAFKRVPPVETVTRDKPLPKTALTPQCRQLLDLLEAKGSVTALEAGGVYRIRSLSRRITDLKQAGYKIVRDLTKDTTGQRYARYYLKGQVPQAIAA